MRFLATLLALAVVGSSFAQSFTDQDRFGKTEEQVVGMKHAQWVEWFCDPVRGGSEQRVTAEKIYAIALYKQNKKVLESKPEAERRFFEDLWVKAANLAKYALTINSAAYPNREGGPLEAAKTGTAINQLISDMLNAKRPADRPTFAQVKTAFEKGSEIMRVETSESESKYIQSHYPAMGKMLERLAKEFRGRSTDDRAHMAAFNLYIIQVATAKPL